MSAHPRAVELPARFEPDAVQAFRFSGRRVDAASGRVELDYALDDLTFTEVIELGAPLDGLDAVRRRAVERALDVLHLLAGVSYFKAAFPARVEVAPEIVVTPALAALVAATYREGLAECAWRNRLPGPPHVALEPAAALPAASSAGLAARALVPVGGGKDSIVALETVRRDLDDVLLFSVGDAAPVRRTVETANLRHRIVRRRIDPALLALNARGARNGHVPVTAINTTLAVIAALLEGCTEVVMADERSASVGSFEWQGLSVNHQWSKGWDFEQRFAALVRAEIAADLDVFSILRPWSELAIARAFAAMPRYHPVFTSCNRVFTMIDPASTWCGECDKCRFVTLILAPWLEPGDVEAIIGRNMLDDPGEIQGYRELTGLDGTKPFECVGEVEESRAALQMAAARPGWAEAAVVAALSREIPQTVPVEPLLAPSPVHAIPDRHARARDALG